MAESNEDLLRKVLAGQATLEANFKAMDKRLEETSEAAFKARDIGNRITTILEEQNVVAKLSEHRNEYRVALADLREDFVAANTRVRNDQDTLRTEMARELVKLESKVDDEVEGLVERIAGLELSRSKVIGVADFFSWMSKITPWLLALGGAVFAGMNLRGPQ